jgi:hypothetical protein
MAMERAKKAAENTRLWRKYRVKRKVFNDKVFDGIEDFVKNSDDYYHVKKITVQTLKGPREQYVTNPMVGVMQKAVSRFARNHPLNGKKNQVLSYVKKHEKTVKKHEKNPPKKVWVSSPPLSFYAKPKPGEAVMVRDQALFAESLKTFFGSYVPKNIEEGQKHAEKLTEIALEKGSDFVSLATKVKAETPEDYVERVNALARGFDSHRELKKMLELVGESPGKQFLYSVEFKKGPLKLAVEVHEPGQAKKNGVKTVGALELSRQAHKYLEGLSKAKGFIPRESIKNKQANAWTEESIKDLTQKLEKSFGKKRFRLAKTPEAVFPAYREGLDKKPVKLTLKAMESLKNKKWELS